MKVDLYTKILLTVIAIATSIIAVQLGLPTASAQRVDSQSGMMMFRLCEKSSYSKINCVDITDDFALKVKIIN